MTCPIVTKELLLKQVNDLEIKADYYCRTDWIAYERTLNELRRLDAILLDMYTKDNPANFFPKDI